MGHRIAADDPRLRAVYDNFRRNRGDICRIGRGAGAAVVVSTVAVNLKDCPPFASAHGSGLSPQELARWEALYKQGINMENQEQAAGSDRQVRGGGEDRQTFRRTGLPPRAMSCRVGDRRTPPNSSRGARCRTSCGFAPTPPSIRLSARWRRNKKPRASAWSTRSDRWPRAICVIGGIPGEGLFYEHVHFNFDGNYLLARALLQEVEAALPTLAGSRKQGPILSRQECAEALALTPWDEPQMAGLIAETSAQAAVQQTVGSCRPHGIAAKAGERIGGLANTPTALDAAYQACQAAFDKTPDDCLSRLHLIKLALASGRPTALEQVRITTQRLPAIPK